MPFFSQNHLNWKGQDMIQVALQNVNRDYLEANYEQLLPLLAKQRREKVLQFKNKEAAFVSMTAGLLLQQVVQQELGILPSKLTIAKEDQGKPYIVGADGFFFNLSHSGDYVALAYGDSPVGIDIEKTNVKDLKVAKRCFAPEEYDYITQGKDDWQKRFCKIWTMKESYLKYTGQGIRVALNSFIVDAERMCVKGKSCRFARWDLEDYILTVCADETIDLQNMKQEILSMHLLSDTEAR